VEALVALGAHDHPESGVLIRRLRSAIDELNCADITVEEVSKFYVSPCFPAGYGNDYVNAAIRVTSALRPAELLSRLHKTEAESGRKRTVRWGERPLDLDLLSVGGEIFPDRKTWKYWNNLPLKAQTVETPEELILPHPRITDRAFVLLPLCDVAPDWVHPVFGTSVDALIAALAPADVSAVVPVAE